MFDESISALRDRIDRLIALVDARESQWLRLIAERDKLQQRVNELEALRCAHPACQLCHPKE